VRMPLLALLAKEPAHGYELKLRFEHMFGNVYPPPNIGQIYLTLQRLERSGLVRSQDVVQSARPNKRVYELTAAGREAVTAWAEEPGDAPRVRDDFFMKLVFGPLTGATDRLGLINRQRRHYLGQMRELSRVAEVTAEDDKVARLLVEGAMLHLQADLDWLQRCQEELM
jgi:DNA-binding PadR family transcriptional regulator